MTTAIAAIVDATIVTALGLLVCRTLRRQPAALRHTVLAASLAATAAAPLLETALPHWEFAVLSGASQVSDSALAFTTEVTTQQAVAIDTPEAARLTWTRVAFVVWAIGFIAVMGGLFAGLGRLIWLTRRCQPMASSRWRDHARSLSMRHALARRAVVLESADRALLLTWGLFRPRIVVPAGAASWPDERVQIVLAHEFAHIVRRDWAVQIAAETIRAAYWFNPLVWLTCRRLRDESELACDDVVLRRVDAADYASHLLAVARQVRASGHRWATAPAIANPSTLERRIAAMLDPSRNRAPLTSGARAFTLLAMLAVAAPVAAVTLTERTVTPAATPSVGGDIALAAAPAPAAVAATPPRQVTRTTRQTKRGTASQTAAAFAQQKPAAASPQNPASLSGTLRDTTGAFLPGVELTLTDAAGTRYAQTTDAGGKFAFRDVPPSQYQLVARLAGFAPLRVELKLAAGEEVQRSLTLRVGSLMETITVACATAGASAPRGAAVAVLASDVRRVERLRNTPLAFAAQTPIRVGGQIQAPKQLKRVAPTCPAGAPGGVVILESTIGTDGKVADVKVLRSIPVLDQSAIDAVRQWEFTPTLLNGSPVPVIMTVTVTYTAK